MLSKLNITNYALIDHLEINFAKGLTIITGETGAGKSIIMGALSLILGERADMKSIRDKSKKSIIEATFDIHGYDLKDFFDTKELDYFPEECILRKEFSDNGRSRTFINDSPVSISVMKELTINLIDIHSQHSNQLISTPAFQLSVIDNLANNNSLLTKYKTQYNIYRRLQKELSDAEAEYQKSKNDEEYLLFQFNQLKQLNLEVDEDSLLEAEQKKMSNLSTIKEALWATSELLDGENGSILSSLATAAKTIIPATEYLPSAKNYADRIESSLIDLTDLARSVAVSQEELDCDPNELERINDRLNSIYTLEKKHGVHTSNDLLQLQSDFERRIETLSNSDETIGKLRFFVEEALSKCQNIANQLSQKRQIAAKEFEKTLIDTCAPLGLRNMLFRVVFNQHELSTTGCDDVNFFVAFNKNQTPMPVVETASGGELSRLMLSIKAIIAKQMNLPTIIFDEVDTGVSGDIADKIGEMMGDLSNRIQVIAITHLPQVASRGCNQMKVYKTDTANSTITSIKYLSQDERVYEIARMLSGKEITQSAIDNAKSLLQNNNFQ